MYRKLFFRHHLVPASLFKYSTVFLMLSSPGIGSSRATLDWTVRLQMAQNKETGNLAGWALCSESGAELRLVSIPLFTPHILLCYCLVTELCLTLATPWTVACKAPLSMRFPRQEHWSGLPFPSPMHEMKSESEITQSCLTLCDPIDCSLPGSSVHGIFQARVLEWGAIAFSAKDC